jgi:hypothetical protein
MGALAPVLAAAAKQITPLVLVMSYWSGLSSCIFLTCCKT